MDKANPFSIALYGQPPGTPCSFSARHQDEEQSQSDSPAANINQPVPARSAGPSAGDTVESGRQAKTAL